MERRTCPIIDLPATGANIRRLRLEKGYSISALQQYLRLESPQAVYCRQRGRNLPSVDNLYAISKLWDVSMNDILVEKAG